MKLYVKSNREFRRYYSATASSGNKYQIIAEGEVGDDSLRLRIGRAESNGRKTYAYGVVGQTKPGRIEVWYPGKDKNFNVQEDFGSFLESGYGIEDADEYLDELAYRAVELVDEVNESLE